MLPQLKESIKRGIVRSGFPSALARLQAQQVVVLRYHSVLNSPAEHADSIGSGIIHSGEVFSQQMEYLSRTCNPVTMNQVLDFVRGTRSVPQRSVAVTFDDGFADNLNVAVPIMNRYGVPGTIYVATDYLSRIPWFCTLRFIFARTQRASFTDPFDGTVRQLDNPKDRRQSFLACSRACAATPRAEIDAAMASLERALDAEYQPGQPIMLNWDGVREILRQGHMVGSHTRTHPNMAYIPAEEISDEMWHSKAVLERETGSEINHFSYPSPIMEPHWTTHTMEACRRAGYDMAVTCSDGSVRSGDEPLAIKRIYSRLELSEFIWVLENVFAGRAIS